VTDSRSVRARTLILLRHAKADWPAGIPDHERPLAARGIREAPLTGRWLVAADLVPEAVLCSTAQRTRETYGLVSSAFETAPAVEYVDDIYDASAGELLEVIRSAPSEARTVLLVGHCPGVQRLGLVLSDDIDSEMSARVYASYPTNTATVLETDAEWSALDPGGATIVDVVTSRG
jgi:phosphohistidine phosphatase